MWSAGNICLAWKRRQPIKKNAADKAANDGIRFFIATEEMTRENTAADKTNKMGIWMSLLTQIPKDKKNATQTKGDLI